MKTPAILNERAATRPIGASVVPNREGSSSMIELSDVSHWFPSPSGPFLALGDVDLQVERGQFVCLVGPSGCGKTTLLNTVAGQVRPERGTVRVTGEGGPGGGAEPIGYMLARDSLIPWRTILDNVAFGLELRKVPKRERRERANEMLDLVGLSGKGALLPRQLSHGMRQRANLARTLAVEPEVLLVDEPFGALDAQTKALLQIEFARIWERTRKTVLFVTHDLDEACLLADRIILMRNGRIEADLQVPFPRPRDLGTLRFQPEFQTRAKSLWDMVAEDAR